jgi:hypothetical protein
MEVEIEFLGHCLEKHWWVMPFSIYVWNIRTTGESHMSTGLASRPYLGAEFGGLYRVYFAE